MTTQSHGTGNVGDKNAPQKSNDLNKRLVGELTVKKLQVPIMTAAISNAYALYK